MKKSNQKKNYVVAKKSQEIAEALGITSSVDQAHISYKAQLSEMASKAIESSKHTVNEIVNRSGVARSKVSAIKNGALAGISIDLFIRVIISTGAKLNMKLAA